MTTPEIYQFIANEKLGVLSSISADGTPQSALVGIAVTPELEIIFDTLLSSRKAHNLTLNPRCSFVIGWSGEITVQLEGAARQPSGPALEHYQKIYFTRWPDGPRVSSGRALATSSSVHMGSLQRLRPKSAADPGIPISNRRSRA